jgi:hypothetical protein
MTARTPSRNVQSGVALPPAADPDPGHVARGERADDVQYQADPNQLVRVRHTQAPDARLPPDIPSAREDEPDRFTSPAVTDVAAPPFGPSVWEALPEDGPDGDGA